MADDKSAMHVDAALVRQLAELLDETRLTEIEVQDGDRKIRVVRKVSVSAPAPTYAPTAAAPVPEAPAPTSVNAVKSPMVGTAFLAAEPGAKPFAAVGDIVSEGQTLLIIEAMKVMNPIAAPRAGKVTSVMVENGQPVEFDQPLLVIE